MFNHIRIFLITLYCFMGICLQNILAQNLVLEYPLNDFNQIALDSFIEFVDGSVGDLLEIDSFSSDSLDYIPKTALDTTPPAIPQWARLEVRNNTTRTNQNYLSISGRYIDSVKIYELSQDSLGFIFHLGMDGKANNNYLYSKRNLVPLALHPNQKRVLFFQIFHSKDSYISILRFRGMLHQDRQLVNSLLRSRGTSFLSEGILIIFALISIFLAFSFRSWDFFYFAVFVLFSTTLIVSDIGIISGHFYPLNKEFLLGIKGRAEGMVFFGGMVLSATLFVSAYLQLKLHMPKFRKYYIGIGILFCVLCVIAYLVSISNDENRFFRTTIFILPLFGIWVPLNLIPIIQGMVKKRTSAFILCIALVLLLFSNWIISSSGLSGNMNGYVRNTFTFFLPFFGTLMYGLINRVTTIQKERLNFRIEKEKSEALLFNILPEEVANELKEKGESQARLIDEVTVLFSDFVEFTRKSGELSPDKLVDELNICFKAFDEIMDEFQIEKIKTIGDAYMAAGGLATDDVIGSAKRVVMAAIKMQEFMTSRRKQNLEEGKTYFDMRVGIHTGPIVAGVVGVKKFQYDLWGDTVNIASRVETNGAVSKVNISIGTYNILKNAPELTFEPRGKISVKGKEEIEMFFVASNIIS